MSEYQHPPNRWILNIKRKRFYIMECMVCKHLWKTKLKNTQKCKDFFEGKCLLDNKCPHPHIYSRSKLKRQEGTEKEEDDEIMLSDEEEELFAPKPASHKKPVPLPSSSGMWQHRSFVSVQQNQQQEIINAHIEIERARRLNITFTWWCQFTMMIPTKLDVPEWLLWYTSNYDSMCCCSMHIPTTASRRLVTEMSGRTEPPELFDGEHLLMQTACLIVDPRTLFQYDGENSFHVSEGSFTSYKSATIVDRTTLYQNCEDITIDWLREEPRDTVAIQRISDVDELEVTDVDNILKEINCLLSIEGAPYFPRLIGTFAFQEQSRSELWVVTDCCLTQNSNQDVDPYTLEALIKRSKTLPHNTVRQVARSMIMAIQHLTTHNWIHLNLYPKVILYDVARNVFFLSSFISVRQCPQGSQITPAPSLKCPFVFTPPEHFPKPKQNKPGFASHKSDVYALGISCTMMLGISPKQIQNQDPSEDDEVYSFVRNCIDVSPTTRLTAEELLNQPFLNS